MSKMEPRRLSTLEKALEINLDYGRYGTFAEIGAGQEVVRWFFQAGGAAGTISKSISAYDMQVSDAIYGDCQRYVSRPRLEAMLAHEQKLTRQRLADSRGATSSFFTFADTVSARNYHGTNDCHAWMGIRFQAEPQAADSVIIIHVRMLDDNNAAQQDAIGIVGVNLIHGAYRHHANPENLIASLRDGLSSDRIEIDMIHFSGKAFDGIDNRILTLQLVQLELTGAAMFSADGDVLQPSDALRKRSLLVQRGRFRPVTHVNVDLLNTARRKFEQSNNEFEQSNNEFEQSNNEFEQSNNSAVGDVLPIMEISMHNLLEDDDICLQDFVSRAEVVSTTGCAVMISDFREYHRLAAYLARYTNQPIGLAMGLATLRSLFEEKYYKDLEGGILEGFGRLFKEQLKLLIYPMRNAASGNIETLRDIELHNSLQHLFNYLVDRQLIVAIDDVSGKYLDIHSPDVLNLIASGDKKWTSLVPESVASIIIERNLFGHST